MRENTYDKIEFFEKYKKMPRSVFGLAGAGEWHALEKVLPSLIGKKVLDLGCGYGWHVEEAFKKGASYVLGIDLSEKMLTVAKEKNKQYPADFLNVAIEDYTYPSEEFDVVFSSLAFHYIEDYERLIQNIDRTLKPGGRLVFTIEHPVYTAEGSQDFIYDENEEAIHFPVDNYYIEGQRKTNFLGEQIIKYHRTLTTYLNTLLKYDFIINEVIEPTPASELVDRPEMKNELRRPMMLIVSARKNKIR